MIALLCLVALAPARGATFIWTNTAGGNWSASNNWSPNQVPGASDTAILTNPGTYTVTLNVNATVTGLELGGESGVQTLSIPSPNLTLTGAGTVGSNGLMVLAGGILDGTGTLTVHGGFNWTAGYMQGAGQTVFSPSAVVTLTTGNDKWLRDRTVTLGGTATWTAGRWFGGYGAVFNIQPGAVLDVQTEASAPGWAGPINLNNAGTLRKSVGTGVAVINWTLNNSGTVQAQSGTLSFGAGGAQTGLFQASDAAAHVQFGGGTHDWLAGVSFSGPGQFSVGGSGYARVQAPVTTGVRWQLLTGAILGGTNTVTFTGPFEWQGGYLQDAGQTVFSPSAVVTLTTGNDKWLRDRTVTLGGTATWTAGRWFGGYGAVFNIQPGAVLDAQSEASAPAWAGSIVLNNRGTLRKSAGTGASSFNWTVTNSAAVRAQSGTLGFQLSYVQSSGSTTLEGGNLAGALLDIQGGTLSGPATSRPTS